ncbi:hypothetical protein [Szabonella alba]|uniref:Uncharacterized protein n=1 Tax=Szabonella alba TaxID=2804194 RepID=A0A8K0VAD2_9RHOB|nr:hypothetical protein [Szabonella alba]MBL4917331.1 hypothetical protein [Szabonella alba]
MPEQLDEVLAMKMSMSAHFAALVNSLDKHNVGLKEDFLKEIERLDLEARGKGGDYTKISESFWWTHQLIRGEKI